MFVLLQNRLLRGVLIRVLRRRNLEVVGYGSREEATTEEVTKSGCDVLLVDFSIGNGYHPSKPTSKMGTGDQDRRQAEYVEGHGQFVEVIRCGVPDTC